MTKRLNTAQRLGALVACALLGASCSSSSDKAGNETTSATGTGSMTEQTASSGAGDSKTPTQSSDVTGSASSTIAEATGSNSGTSSDTVREVPGEYDTIQAAVDAASPGDMILISPGTYHEAVDVETDRLVIRGLDRDKVVLDGELKLDNGIRVLGASGVAVENLTAMNYSTNGVFFVSVTGYRASYVTTYRTGDYGIYAFDSVTGQIDHSHTVGSRDAGVYVGQCYKCDAVVDAVESTNNGIGYSGTNSGGNLTIVNSSFHDNRVGIVPNSGSYELCYPERETTIIGNLVYNNNAKDTPGIDVALLAQGNGILVAGGIGNIIERNRVDNHFRTGIGLVPYLEEKPNDDLPTKDEWTTPCADQKSQAPNIPDGSILWDSFNNSVRDNVVTGSGEADLAVASAGGDISTFGNCFAGNTATKTAPTDLQGLAPCDGTATSTNWAAGDLQVTRWLAEQSTLPPEVDWKTAPLPQLGPHENMADPATAPARPATDVPYEIDTDAITTPDLP